ncbi:hypothetical protein ES708_13264 [subsurface metagenome]
MAPDHFSNDKSEAKGSQAQPKFDWPALQHAILFYQDNHLCCVPVPFGEKKYNFQHAGNQGWEAFQKARPSQRQLSQWFREDTPTNIAIICGGVSDGLVALCFNEPNGAELFFGKERWENLLLATFVVKTSRGHHVYLRSSTEIISQDFTKDGQLCWLEVRSGGRYIMAPPSKHPSRLIYTNIGVEEIHKPKDLSGFIAKRLSELGLKTFKASEKAKPPLTELDKGVEELLRKDLTLGQIAEELGVLRGQVMTSLQRIDLPGLFSELKGEGSPVPFFNATLCYDLLERRPGGDSSPKKELTLTQAIERYEEIYTKAVAEQAQEDDKLAVGKLLESCAFMQYCADHAVTLSETYWWSEACILTSLGEPGKEKYHELSKSYHTDRNVYTEKETNDKIKAAEKSLEEGKGFHTCKFIQENLGFVCPEDCQVKKLKGITSPVGFARVLVKREKSGKYLIGKTNVKGDVTSVTVDKRKLIEDLKSEFIFKSVFGLVRDDILVYKDGVYTFDGEKLIREECESRVPPPALTTHMCHEIRDRIAGTTFTDRERFNTEKYTINLENGLLDVRTRKLSPHTPVFLSTVRIPIAYDPQAKCPKIEKFLGDILRQEDIKVILEFFGYIVIPDYSIPVVLILLGEGSNGKTQLLRLLGQFIGRGNYVSVSLQDIENNTFAVASLEGKLLNMQGDLSSQWLSGIGMLKQLSGQDPITANRKYRDPLHFDNVARLVFASNRPPKIEEDTLAVWRRILPIDLPNTFQGEKDVKNYIGTILTPQELSGLLNLALDSLQQLLNKSDFSYQGSYADRSRQYTIASDPARAFVEERCDVGAEFKVLKEELYEAYKIFCNEHRVQLSGDSQFAKELREVPGLSISDHQYQKDGVRVRWWLRIQLKGKEEEEGVRTENTPDYPQEKCPTCGGEEFYLTKDDQYLCSHCHPQPQEIDMEV